VKTYFWLSKDFEDSLKEIFENLGFQEEKNVEKAEIILINPPFPIKKAISLKFEVPEKKWAFFIPKDVIEEIKEGKKLEAKYEILKPFAILNFFSFIKEEMGSEI